MKRYHIRKRAPNAHAIATGNKIRQIRSTNPGISPQQALAMASKSTAHGSGLYIAPSPFNTTERIFFYLIGLFWAIVIGGIVGGVVGYLGTSQKPIE